MLINSLAGPFIWTSRFTSATNTARFDYCKHLHKTIQHILPMALFYFLLSLGVLVVVAFNVFFLSI